MPGMQLPSQLPGGLSRAGPDSALPRCLLLPASPPLNWPVLAQECSQGTREDQYGSAWALKFSWGWQPRLQPWIWIRVMLKTNGEAA